MTTLTNDNETEAVKRETGKRETGGAFADGLTLVRVLLTPVIIFVIIKAWSAKPGDAEGFVSLNIKLVLLASTLFALAAITDFLDDYFGGSALTGERLFGWIDDIADSILIGGTLLALLWVTSKAGMLNWTFAIPVALFIGRDIVLALARGFEISRSGLRETRLGNLKSALAMLATCILVAAPWLTSLIDSWRANRTQDIIEVYGTASTWAWNTGLVVLWLAVLLSLVTGWKLLRTKAA